MLLAYLTTDEVNLDLARRLAADCGAALYPLFFDEIPQEGQFDAILFDWDYLPLSRRQDLLRELRAEPSPYPVGLHSYHLEEHEVEALSRNGVAVFRQLNLEVFRVLGQAARVPRDGDALSSLQRAQRNAEQSPREAVHDRAGAIAGRMPSANGIRESDGRDSSGRTCSGSEGR